MEYTLVLDPVTGQYQLTEKTTTESVVTLDLNQIDYIIKQLEIRLEALRAARATV